MTCICVRSVAAHLHCCMYKEGLTAGYLLAGTCADAALRHCIRHVVPSQPQCAAWRPQAGQCLVEETAGGILWPPSQDHRLWTVKVGYVTMPGSGYDVGMSELQHCMALCYSSWLSVTGSNSPVDDYILDVQDCCISPSALFLLLA